MRVVEDHRGGIEALGNVRTAPEAQARPLCTGGYPRKREVGHQVVVVVEPADVAVAAGEESLGDSTLPALERHIAEEPPRLVPRHGVAGARHVGRTFLGNVESNRRVDGIPEPEVGDRHPSLSSQAAK